MPLHKIFVAGCCLMLAGMSGCGDNKTSSNAAAPAIFGTLHDGRNAMLYTLRNKNGLETAITNFGGIVISLRVPDRKGALEDIVLGYDSLRQYEADRSYFGAIVGRYGNRIGNAKFTLDGSEYTLAANDGGNHLHGGLRGFNKVLWTVDEKRSVPGRSLTLTYSSPDGEEGYPGALSVTFIYTLNDENELVIEYEAITDKPTVVNLTHHSYFNLAGAGARDVLDHELMIAADRFTPVDEGLIPTGELQSVEGTPMDFRTPTRIGDRIDYEDGQIHRGRGYDHNWVLNRESDLLQVVASLFEPTTGRLMEVLTTEPGLQFYSGNFLDGTTRGKSGREYRLRTGLCLETQHFPDSPNKPDFPSTVLRPGERYHTVTAYRFTAR